LISEETYQHIHDKFTSQFIGTVQLKGRQQSIKIYQILAG
jgi:class 3 adenylate cyclase